MGDNCFENTLGLLGLRREGFPNFLLMLLKKFSQNNHFFCGGWRFWWGGPKILLFENLVISNISERYSTS